MEESLETILRQLDTFEEETLRLRLYISLLGGELEQSVLVPDNLKNHLQHYGIQLRHGRTVMDETEIDVDEYDERMARIYVDQRKPGETLARSMDLNRRPSGDRSGEGRQCALAELRGLDLGTQKADALDVGECSAFETRHHRRERRRAGRR